MLGFRLVDNYTDLNRFDVVETLQFTPSQDTEIYLQLSRESSCGNDSCPYLRYLPVAGSTIVVTFENIDSSKVITRPATQIIPNDDRSIWKVQILPGETIAAGSMIVNLTENGVTKTLTSFSTLNITPTGTGRFFC